MFASQYVNTANCVFKPLTAAHSEWESGLPAEPQLPLPSPSTFAYPHSGTSGSTPARPQLPFPALFLLLSPTPLSGTSGSTPGPTPLPFPVLPSHAARTPALHPHKPGPT